MHVTFGTNTKSGKNEKTFNPSQLLLLKPIRQFQKLTLVVSLIYSKVARIRTSTKEWLSPLVQPLLGLNRTYRKYKWNGWTPPCLPPPPLSLAILFPPSFSLHLPVPLRRVLQLVHKIWAWVLVCKSGVSFFFTQKNEVISIFSQICWKYNINWTIKKMLKLKTVTWLDISTLFKYIFFAFVPNTLLDCLHFKRK